MNKIKKVILIFDDSTEMLMESHGEIDIKTETKLRLLPRSDFDEPSDFDSLRILYQEDRHTKVTIEFLLSKVDVKTPEYLVSLRQ